MASFTDIISSHRARNFIVRFVCRLASACLGSKPGRDSSPPRAAPRSPSIDIRRSLLSNSVNGFHLYISKSFVSFDRKKNDIENSLTDLVNSTGKGTRRPVKLCRDGVASTAVSLPASLVAASRLPSKSGHVLFFFSNFLLKVTQLTHAVPWVNFCSKIRGQ